MPIPLGLVKLWGQRFVKLPIICSLLHPLLPALIAQSKNPCGVSRNAFYFFGNAVLRALTMSCTQLFELRFDIPMISLPAATRIAMMAAVVGSI